MNKLSFLIRRIIRGKQPITTCSFNSDLLGVCTHEYAIVEVERIIRLLYTFRHEVRYEYPFIYPWGLCEMVRIDYVQNLLRWFAPLFYTAYFYTPMRWNLKSGIVYNIKESIDPRIRLMLVILKYLKSIK